MNVETSILAQSLAFRATFFSRVGEHRDDLIKSFRVGAQPGKTTHIKCLDENLTLRPGFLYAFTGWPGSGKSEFITQIAVLQAEFEKNKIAFYSPENYPKLEFEDTIIQCYLGKSTDRRFPNVCSEQEYNEAVTWADKYFYLCDWEENTPSVTDILNGFKYLAKEEGVKIFVVDPFNSLITENESSNMAVALKNNLTAFKRFCVQQNAIVILIEHPKTPVDSKEYDNIPTNRNMFGGTMWWNKIDVGVTVHRPNRDDKNDTSVIIKVWKVKRQKLNGRPGEKTLHFSIRTNRYYEDQFERVHPMNPPDLYVKPNNNYKSINFYEKD